MPFFRCSDKLLFFVHAPKAGGSSVEDYLIRRFDDVFVYSGGGRSGVGKGTGLISPITHLCAWDLEDFLPTQMDLVFTLVRNPLSRILSEYRWQRGSSQASRLDFSTWLNVMIKAARIDRRTYRNHIRPTSELVPERAEIFRLEDGFDAMVDRIDEATGTTAPDITVGHLKNRGKASEPIKLTRQDVALIADFYAVDYERFGYSPPDPNDYDSDGMAFARRLAASPIAQLALTKQRRDWLR